MACEVRCDVNPKQTSKTTFPRLVVCIQSDQCTCEER